MATRSLRDLLLDHPFRHLLIKLDIEDAKRSVLADLFTKLPAGEIITVMKLHEIQHNRSFVEQLAADQGFELEFFELGTFTGHCQMTRKM